MLAHGEQALDPAHATAYVSLLERRARGEPVAYLRGVVEWLDLELEISPDVLVPRPETELLVERAVAVDGGAAVRSVADVGTGSGAIAVALARRLPAATVIGVDVSERALQVAARNLARYGLSDRVRLLRGNLLEPLDSPPDMLVANLPYLSDAMMRSLGPDVRFEPSLALHGGKSGLELYGEMLRQVASRGWEPRILFEIDARQSPGARRLVRDLLPGMRFSIFRDYAGRDRMVSLDPSGATP